MKIAFLLLLTMTLSFSETLSEIKGLIQDHEYTRAEVALKAGLHEHPKSALGWYYLAQDEYLQNNFGLARIALAKAQALDPQLTFTHDPQEFYRLQEQLSPVASVSTPARPAYSAAPSPGFDWLGVLFWLIVLIVGVALVSALFAAFRRPSTTYVGGNFGTQPQPPPPANYPQYPPTYPTPGSGVGSFLGGLATGVIVDDLLRPRTEIIEEQVIVEPEERAVDRPSDPLPFDPGNTNQDWSSNDNSGGFDSGNAPDNTNNW